MNRIALVLFNVYCYSLVVAASLTVIPLLTVIVSLLGVFSKRRTTMKRFRRGISWYGRIVTAIPYPFIKLRYEDHSARGESGPYIFVSNHRSASDAFLMCVLP